MYWLLLIIAALAAAGLSGFIVYHRLSPRIVAAKELDYETEKRNEILRCENMDLTNENDHLKSVNATLKNDTEKLDLQKQSAIEQIQGLNSSISAMEKQAQEAADLFYESKMQIAQEKLQMSLEEENLKYQANIIGFQEEYNKVVADLVESCKELEGNVAILRATNDAAVAAAKRAEEMKDKLAFYKIQLSDLDISEIDMLRSVEPYLRDKEPLNKVIWKCYYEKPTTDMIGRVVGGGTKTGIYKITEIATGKCYVGQAANIADRWKQHIKRGVGAEAPTRNKLYPAMIAAGPENFTFEVIEVCDRTMLDEREKYWTDYFKAQEFGFSIRKG